MKLRDERHAELRSGVRPDTERRTVGDVARWFYAEFEAFGYAPNTVSRVGYDHARVVDATLKAAISDLRADKLERPQVLAWRGEIATRDSRNSSNRALGYLKRVLEEAAANDWIAKNPCARIKPLREPKRRGPKKTVKFFDVDELGRLLRAATWHEAAGDFVRLASDAGARLGELLGATWSRIDLEHEGRWTIDRQAVRDPVTGAVDFGPLKTENSYRSTLLCDRTLTALRARRARQKLKGYSGDLVFPARGGAFMRHGNFRQRVWWPTIERAGVQRLGPHALRHTCASLLLAARVSVVEVAARIGDTVQTVMDTYAHAVPSEEGVVRDNVGALFERAEPEGALA